MIKGKQGLRETFRPPVKLRKRGGKLLVRQVKSTPPLIRSYELEENYLKGEPVYKRFPTNDDLFGVLQDVQAELFLANRDYPADDPYNGTTKASRSPSAPKALPLSPLMNSKLLAARRRYTKTKPPPGKELSDFQSLLERNPYATILASPVRTCILTGVRLPCSLFQPFTIQHHPRTRAPWFVPKGFEYLVVPGTASTTPFLPPRSHSKVEEPHRSNTESPTSSTQGSASEPPELLPIRTVRSFVPASPLSTSLPSVNSTAYLTKQSAALAHIASLKPRSLYRILPFRWKTHFGVSLKSTICREDLSEFVLIHLRKRVIHQILALCDEDFSYFAAYSKVAGGGSPQMGAVLWGGAPRQGHENSSEREPEAYMMVPVPGTNRTVPMYNLRVLVGIDGLRELDNRKGGFWRGSEMVGVKAQGKAIELLVELWQILLSIRGEGKGLRKWKVREGRKAVGFEAEGDDGEGW
ncbi:hypothetical protein MMC26_005991 [Xylographa opegraphella]|nr:hypothetical protein [Xylographa opegraphella]